MKNTSVNSTTRNLLACGALAGPLYISLGVLQIFIREGYDPTRHDLSVLSNGDLGWIQIGNFLLTGMLVILGAIGVKRVIKTGTGKIWGPILLGLYGLGLIGAGIFIADPMYGFPPGTPNSMPKMMSTNGLMHLVSGSVGFLGLISACFVFARRFSNLKQKGWAMYSMATGISFFASFVGIASGSSSPFIVLSFTAAVIISWIWLTTVSNLLKKNA